MGNILISKTGAYVSGGDEESADAYPLIRSNSFIACDLIPAQETYRGPLGSVEFAENPEPRIAVTLLLDTSSSMRGDPISELNHGIMNFAAFVEEDPLARKRLELSVIQFGPVRVMSDFCTLDGFQLPELVATGDTPIGEAVSLAVHRTEERVLRYRDNGVNYYKPLIFLITDGQPTDQWQGAAHLLHAGVARKDFNFFPVAVAGAQLDILQQLSPTPPKLLRGIEFSEFFLWLSKSIAIVSRSTVGGTVIPPPTTAWEAF